MLQRRPHERNTPRTCIGWHGGNPVLAAMATSEANGLAEKIATRPPLSPNKKKKPVSFRFVSFPRFLCAATRVVVFMP